jgi:hypothetical protein
MSSIDKKQAGRAKRGRAVGRGAGRLGWLAMCLLCHRPGSVDTIGGGVRVECGRPTALPAATRMTTRNSTLPYSCALDTNGNLWIADKTITTLSKSARPAINRQHHDRILHRQRDLAAFRDQLSLPLPISPAWRWIPANNLYVLLPSPPQVYQVRNLTAQSTSLNVLSALF